ncbi:MAG: glutamate-cysteine ligase family protein [Myxococcota bacterium]|nr:glutamate-cysteine ligase family protein [Myxococcota bacterium]
MSRDVEQAGSPEIEGEDHLVAYFSDAETEPSQRLVGTETERIALWRDGLGPVDYDRGIKPILLALNERGWEIAPEGEQPLSAHRGDVSVSLEPGGQIELAGAPLKTIDETAAEVEAFNTELKEVCAGLGIVLSTLGMRPVTGVDGACWMPRARYRAMRDYLGARGTTGHHMMVLTTTIQSNLDYESEDDMVSMVRLANSVSPVAAALFANSPIEDGRWTGWRSRRSAIWFDVDEERCGLLPFVYHDDFGYRRYLDYVLDVPMFFLQRGTMFHDVNRLTFREFLRSGFEGERATLADFETHLSTLFPEVRIKRFVEVRSADSGPTEMTPALSAFWKGLFYDSQARRDAWQLVEGFSIHDLRQMQRGAAQDGLRAHGARWSMTELSRELLRLAGEGLDRIGDGPGQESRYLAPLQALVNEGATLADQLIERYGAGPWGSEALSEMVLHHTL